MNRSGACFIVHPRDEEVVVILRGSMVEAAAIMALMVACIVTMRYWREVIEGVRAFKEHLGALDDVFFGPRR